MTTKEINKMTVERLKALPIDQLQDYIDTTKANNLIITDIIRDRNLFKRLYYDLLEQITNEGLEPVNTYEKILNKKGN